MAKQLELTPRLQRLADWVRPGAAIADVGTDHAYLPVWLVLHGRTRSAIASDLRSGPLSRARETGRLYDVEGRIEFRLCPGLDAVAPEEADTILIAGMGGETIASILAAAPWTADGHHTLLLQPMSHADGLRTFLQDHGYAIRRESLVLDRGTLYPVMEAAKGEMSLSLGQRFAGTGLPHDPLGERYLVEKIVRLHMALGGLRRGGAENQERAKGLRELIAALLEMREEWRHANCENN